MKSVEGDIPDEERSRVSFWRRAEWKLIWHLGFRKCSETSKQLWPFTKVWVGKAIWTGPGTPVIEKKWVSPQAYTYLKLKGKV